MRAIFSLSTVAVVAAIVLRVGLGAQTPAPPAVPSPAWAYGVPPAPPPGDPAATAGNRAAGAAQPTGTAGGQRPGGAPGAAAAPGGGQRGAPDTSLKHIPDSTLEFTLANIRDFFNVADWFPGDHPAPPDVILKGRAPSVRGCGMCHMPNGKGRPENAPVAGLPYTYILQQLTDFKNDLRGPADPRKTNTGQMIEAAKAMTDDEIKGAAAYFSSMKWTPWIRVVEADVVPKTRLSGNVFFRLEPDQGTEPIGNRIIESPEDTARFELRDPHSGFVAYVPKGSIAKGAALVSGGGGKTFVCATCHASDLMGLGPVPGIAGRSPSYLMRQLWDIKQSARKGAWSPLMTQVVKNLTQDDMLNIVAYVSSVKVQ